MKKRCCNCSRWEAVNDTIVKVKAGGIENGANLQPFYYNNGNPVIDWKLMKQQTKIKTVRIEIEPGFETQAKNWISGAVGNGFSGMGAGNSYSSSATSFSLANYFNVVYAKL